MIYLVVVMIFIFQIEYNNHGDFFDRYLFSACSSTVRLENNEYENQIGAACTNSKIFALKVGILFCFFVSRDKL